MCGIVGYLGPENPCDVIVNGLKALEYRGYDSSGVTIFDDKVFKRVRAEGKLSALQDKLENEKFSGRTGIGHTRWATHGPPVERNAHPHAVKGISIVHNGIIENYAELRETLVAGGSQMTSDTDSELIAHLISAQVDQGKELLAAVEAIVPQLEGAYAILAVSNDQPDEFIAVKNGPPLILGLPEEGFVAASDILAIMPYTQKVIYLNDHEVAQLKKDGLSLYDQNHKKIDPRIHEIDWNQEKVEKQGFDHYMLKEIFEQPRVVAAALDTHICLKTHKVIPNRLGFGYSPEELEGLNLEEDLQNTKKVLDSVERIFIIACGTSYYAGQITKYFIEDLARVPVEIDFASEFRYRNPIIPKNSLVVLVSQSGETADTLAALRLAKEQGAKILSICNVKNSTIDREADGHLYMNAGTEIGVASTKALTCTIAVMGIFSVFLAKSRGKIDEAREKQLVESFLAAPSHMENTLAYDNFFLKASETLKNYKGFLYMGRGLSFPVAMEGALKLKELAYMHAEGYAAGEMKHGPLALIDEDMAIVMLAPLDRHYEKTVSNLEEARARGGQIISIGTGENERLKEMSVHYLSIPKVDPMVNPLLTLIPLQLLSYHVADALGYDVDQPRNLAKSVTVE